MRFLKVVAFLLAASIATTLHAADAARFDLTGPKIDVRVTRGNTTLPIAEVPNLQPGDKIWVKADLPSTQSNHLLLIVAFLRGTTNEPPDEWFTEIDTWNKKTVEGATITVPDEAQQALMFVAPETGGDFKTLRSAVKGKPGLFIRADADLNEASFEQQRIERYLAAMKTVPQDDSKAIQEHSAKLAATLALKPNADCFKQPVDQQVNCLTQSSAPLLMDDGHGQTVADALSSGASSDFINTASTTQVAGAGVYSAYVGAVVDLVHLVSLLRTAQYQYIPGLSFPQDATLNLKLNAPPSFHNPKSVIVIGLPAIQKAKLPPLHPHAANQIACLLQPNMPLLLEGAPLVFSTGFAHDLMLHLNRTAGSPTDLPLRADAFEGGLVVSKDEPRKPLADQGAGTSAAGVANTTKAGDDKAMPTSGDVTITGTIRGYWGFDPFDGPTLTLQQVDGKSWKIAGDTQLLAGQDNHFTLQGDGVACVQQIALANEKDKDINVAFKAADDNGKGAGGDKSTGDSTKAAGSDGSAGAKLDLDVSLKTVQPGGYSLAIQQYGEADKTKVALTAYSSDIHLDGLKIHEGDSAAVLSGQGLQNVVSVQIAGQSFSPGGDGNSDTAVHLEAKSGASPAAGSDAIVKLKDGRTMTVKVSTEAARPSLKLLSFQATPAQQSGDLAVTLGGKNDIPLNGKLTFVVQTEKVFPRTQTVEVATADGGVHTSLSLASNNLVLQDEHTAVATLEPLKVFGQSAFGKLQMRPVAEDGTGGDWTPLGTLVRAPQITAIHCTTGQAPACTLNASNLFLVQAFGSSKEFAKPAEVPTGFASDSLTVPVPEDGSTLYLKLRDDPSALASVKLPAPLAQPARTTPAAPPAAGASATANSPASTGTPASSAAASSTAVDTAPSANPVPQAAPTDSPAPPAATGTPSPPVPPAPSAAPPAAAAAVPSSPPDPAAPAPAATSTKPPAATKPPAPAENSNPAPPQ